MYSIGIDIGYSTLKCIVLNKEKKLAYESCIFHHGNMKNELNKQLQNIKERIGEDNFYIGVTGEQREQFDKYQINDISALVEGVSYSNNNAESIIEIGAQSSRFITGFSKDEKANIKFSMNSSCSAGTGSFLEEQASRLGIELDDFSNCIEKATKIPRIAGRCSVFSKTDMIHHQQEGVKTEDILLGLSYALIRNYKANVVRRMKINKPIMFIGGVANNKGVVKALKDIFNLEDNELIISDNCSNMGAIGAGLIANNKKFQSNFEEILQCLNQKERNKAMNYYESLEAYGLDDHVNKHVCKNDKESVIKAYLGIDIGSTSTNLVLINESKEVISYRYLKTKGNPKNAVEVGIKSIKEEFNNELIIKGIGTTGSGRTLIGKQLNANLIVNEITAQAKGATELDEDVDTIFEIGGQDSKYISIQNGRVVDFEMNKICSAGTGSFIEEQSKKLNIPIEEYEKFALKGECPIDLGDRCTVFIEGNISKALAEEKSKENITAGLSYSIVNNYLNKVVNKKPIGNKILLQGGIAYNQGVINAFRATLGKNITIPPFFSVTGAFGVALLTREEAINQKNKEKKISELPNMENEIKKLFLKGYSEKKDDKKLTIGIPRVLFIHKLFPMLNEFFKTLGFNVILSEETDKHIIALSQQYAQDETCYPMKLINGHVASLIKKGVDYIFLPSLYTMKHPISKTREDYACVYMQTAPQIISKNMDLKGKGIKLLSPALSFKFGKKYMMKTLMDLGQKLGKSKVQTTLALKNGMIRFKNFEEEVEELGKTLINYLEEDEKVFVIITRTYGIADEGLNMEIPRRLKEMGYKVLTLSNLPAHSYDLSKDYANMYWPFGQHILSGAKIVKEHKNLYAIYLTNHGCGPDTILSHYFKEEMGEKPYLHIEVDEHDSNIGVMTRLEAFIDSLNNNKTYKQDFKIANSHKDYKKLYIPYLYPYSHLLQATLEVKGFEVELLQPTDKDSLNIGEKYITSKEYLSLTALLGDVFKKIKKTDKQNSAIWVPQTEGSETYGQYGRLLEQKLKIEEYENIYVESPFIEDLLENETYGMDLILILIAGDIIMTASKENRDKYLNIILGYIKQGTLNKNILVTIANDIYKQLSNIVYGKSIYALGEISIVFNPILNNYQLDKLEEDNKVYYQPISEIMYFRWSDYLNKEKKKHLLLKERLKIMKSIMNEISNTLGEYTSFDKDVDEMMDITNDLLPLYSGGNGRYRMVKPLRISNNINGVFHLNSMYENTGTILKLLKNEDEQSRSIPTLELSFDGSSHSSNNEKINNFIYYI
jgi:predicted CoA-substrate-specific enzyme activase